MCKALASEQTMMGRLPRGIAVGRVRRYEEVVEGWATATFN